MLNRAQPCTGARPTSDPVARPRYEYPMPDSPLQVFVDQMLDHAGAENPGVELTITMSSANTPLLPLRAREAVRVVNGVIGSCAGHVYRDCLINDWNVPGLVACQELQALCTLSRVSEGFVPKGPEKSCCAIARPVRRTRGAGRGGRGWKWTGMT